MFVFVFVLWLWLEGAAGLAMMLHHRTMQQLFQAWRTDCVVYPGPLWPKDLHLIPLTLLEEEEEENDD